MKTKHLAILLSALLTPALVMAQRVVHIEGSVERVHRSDMQIRAYVRDGNSTNELATTTVSPDLTYKLDIQVADDCEATIDCGGWQTVQVWLCDENLQIDFVGGDTTEVRSNDPFYVDQRGGRNAELMNLINMEQYRNFAQQTANAVSVFGSKDIPTMLQKKRISFEVNEAVMSSTMNYWRYLARHYADRPAVMAVLRRLDVVEDAELVKETMRKLEAASDEGARVIAAYHKQKQHERELRERTAPGHQAPDFTFQDAVGTVKHLSDFIGKNDVVVLDFWASWCAPCRREIQNLKQYYPHLKEHSVEFLSVSLDANREAWQKAMKQEGMAWQQGWTTDAGQAVMNEYQFGAIPFIVVIDKKGRIFNKGVRGPSLPYIVDDALKGRGLEIESRE